MKRHNDMNAYPRAAPRVLRTIGPVCFLLAIVAQLAAAVSQEPSPETTAAAPIEKATRREGDWLEDSEGRLYREDRIAKKDLGKFVRLDGNRIRTPWGFEIDYIREDEDAFFLYAFERTYEPPDPSAGPTAEELEEVAATYRFELPSSDRIELVSFGKGLPRSGLWRQGFDVGDMNGDGELDIVHGPPRKSESVPVVILGDGEGNWRPWTDAVFPPFAYDYGDAAVADFDSDGRLDLALGNHLRGQVVLLQREPGRFVLHSKGLDFHAPGDAGEVVFSSRAIETVDWDRDGRLDILALGEGPMLNLHPTPDRPAMQGSFGLVLYRNLGQDGWERRGLGNEFEQSFGDALKVADLDGDGRVDAVRATHSAGHRKILHYGTDDGLANERELEGIRPHTYVRGVAIRDFDDDGRLDLALSFMTYELDRWRTGIDLHFAREGGSWERRSLYAKEGREIIWTLDDGDVDGDGRIDLVGLTGEAGVLVFLGTGPGRFSLEKEDDPLPRRAGCRGYHVRLIDLDGDGADEIIASFAGERAGFVGVVDQPGCPGGGSVQAWKAVEKSVSETP